MFVHPVFGDMVFTLGNISIPFKQATQNEFTWQRQTLNFLKKSLIAGNRERERQEVPGDVKPEQH